MATADEIRVLKDICKELHEINKRLDRLCQASIFQTPKKDSQEKQSL